MEIIKCHQNRTSKLKGIKTCRGGGSKLCDVIYDQLMKKNIEKIYFDIFEEESFG